MMPVLGVGTTAHSKNLSNCIIRDLASQPLTKPYSHESRFKAPFIRKGKGMQSPTALKDSKNSEDMPQIPAGDHTQLRSRLAWDGE